MMKPKYYMLHGFGGGIPVYKAYSKKQVAEYLEQPYHWILSFCQEYVGTLDGIIIDTDLTKDCVCKHNFKDHYLALLAFTNYPQRVCGLCNCRKFKEVQEA